MKRILSVLLAGLVVFSMGVTAFPSMADIVESTEETYMDAAEEKNSNTNAVLHSEDVIKTLFVKFEKIDSLGFTTHDTVNKTTENGVLSYTSEKQDSQIVMPADIYANDYANAVVRMKWECVARNDGASPSIQLFYEGVDSAGNAVTMSQSNSVKVNIPLSSDGEYKNITLPLTKATLDGLTVTKIRLDPVNTNGTVSVDYMMLVPKNVFTNMAWHFNTDGAAEDWGIYFDDVKVENGVAFGKTNATNNTFKRTVSPFKGSDYPKAYIRMKVDNLSSDATLYFDTKLVDENGNEVKSLYGTVDGFRCPSGYTVSKSGNGKWKLYEIDFTPYSLYLDNYISQLSINVNKAGADVAVDYIAIPHKNSLEWDFETDDFACGLTLKNPENQQVKNGHLSCTTLPSDKYVNTQVNIENVSLNANDWAGLEVVVKHNITGNSQLSKLYYAGVSASGENFNYSETNKAALTFTPASTKEGSAYYYFDFSKCASWANSTITNLRWDVLKDIGSYEIDYMRLVPKSNVVRKPLDESRVSLDYDFEDNKQGTADGIISVDFGSQDAVNAKSVVLKWASGNSTDGYTQLGDYTVIKVLEGVDAQSGYKIDKNLLIPFGATALLAEVSDCEKTFTKVFEIPEEKRKQDRGEPLYSVGLISDIHVGGHGSEIAPNNRLVAVREQLSEMTDHVVVVGDLTQWYGAYSEAEFKAYNYDGTIYANNGETSPEYLGIGNSQWTVLTDYFKGFSVPVYAVQGNHDIRDKDSWSTLIESEKYWRPFLEDWVNYSNTAENGLKYQKEAVLHEDNNYYDTVINGHHYIFLVIPRSQKPHYEFGDEQLAWLDKKMYEHEQSGEPIFVFGHVPVTYHWDATLDGSKLQEILAKHPTAIYTSGHSHYSLDVDFYMSTDGAQETPSYIHDGGAISINVPNDESVFAKGQEVEGSHGVVAKVYSDGIELWGRDFLNEKWISRGYTYLTFKEKCDIPDIEITKSDSEGNTLLTANLVEDAVYTWIFDGEESEITCNSVSVANDYEGYVALRITTADGAYRSEVYENLDSIPCGELLKSDESVSFRVGNIQTTTGIRYAASISLTDREKVCEYGFIVTRQSFLEAYGTELTFDFKTSSGKPLYVHGKNFAKDLLGNVTVDKVFEAIDNGVKFSAVITGLNINDPSQVREVMVARPYAKLIADGEEKIVYGKNVSASLKQVAEYIRENDAEFYADNMELIDKLANV